METIRTFRLFAATLSAICLIACTSGAEADFSVAEPFLDGMIFAKEKPFHVFGNGAGRVSVKVLNGNGSVITSASSRASDGIWDVCLPPVKAGGPYTMVIKSKNGSQVLNDIYSGYVIMVSGQSNMQFGLRSSSTPKEEWKGDPMLRSYSLPRIEKGEPYSPADGWVACTDSNAGNWSAIGYHIGKLLRERTGEPTAIINCYQGASTIQSWIPKGIATRPEYILPEELLHKDHRKYSDWNVPGTLYDYSLSRIFPYTLSEVIWYQGESNTGEGEYKIYPALAKELVNSWREAFKDPELPFIMVQIADFSYRDDDAWKNLQEAQMTIPSIVDGVKVVRSADVCESDNIHPKTKSVLSARITDAILE